MNATIMAETRARGVTINYSHLPDADSISHGQIFVALANVYIYKSLSDARKRSHKNISTSEVFTVAVNDILLLDIQYDKSGHYRRALLPMPGPLIFISYFLL